MILLILGIDQGQQSDSTRSRTLHQLLNKHDNQWNKTSLQYNEKLDAVRDWIVKTGQPITVVDNPEFRTLVKRLDAKFKMPGECGLLSEFYSINQF